MQLVICDDNLKDLTELENLLQKYSGRCQEIRFEVGRFSDPSLLLHNIQTGQLADIYILDILMSKMTGIDLGNEIRKSNRKSVIIYVTSSDGFAIDAYGLHAARYLLKPVGEGAFFEALDYALSQVDARKDYVYLVKTKDGLEAIPYPEIEYIENSARRLEIHLVNGKKTTSIYLRKSFEAETKELANARNFIYVHKSFLINLDYVRKLKQGCVLMESGTSIPVSRKGSFDVKKEYLLFISEQYR